MYDTHFLFIQLYLTVNLKEYLDLVCIFITLSLCATVYVCICVCVCVYLVDREDSLVILLLKTDRSNRSPVTEFSPRLQGITVKARGHWGRLTLIVLNLLYVCVSLGGGLDLTSGIFTGAALSKLLTYESFYSL